MLLKPLFRLPQKMNFHFVKYFKLCFGLSIVAIVGTAVLLSTIGLNFGIDFKGGTLMQMQTPWRRMRLSSGQSSTRLGMGEIQFQNFGKTDELLIRFPEQAGGPEAQKVAADKVLQALPAGSKELRREQVGSTVSKELIKSAIWAIVLTNLVIFAYVWFRFEWQFALGAVVSLIHDVMVTLGVLSLFQLDFDLTIVAALLTILGYSINDTVVIYDRIRENLRKYKRMPLRRSARSFGERDDVANHHDGQHGHDGADCALLLRRRGHSRVHLRDAVRRARRHLFLGLYRRALPDHDRRQARLERRGKGQGQAGPAGSQSGACRGRQRQLQARLSDRSASEWFPGIGWRSSSQHRFLRIDPAR